MIGRIMGSLVIGFLVIVVAFCVVFESAVSLHLLVHDDPAFVEMVRQQAQDAKGTP